MTSVFKHAGRTMLLLCIMLLGTATISFADTDSDANQPLESSMNYEIDGTTVPVKIDEDLLKQLDPQSVYSLAKEYSSESLRIVSEDNLSQEDLEDSSEIVLFVYADKKLVRFEVDSGYADKMTLEEAKSMIEESAKSDSNNVHVYEAGSGDGFFVGHKNLVSLGLIIIVVVAAWIFKKRR